METIRGAWLNQTKKLMKKAIQVKWRMRIFPLKENMFKLDDEADIDFFLLRNDRTPHD